LNVKNQTVATYQFYKIGEVVTFIKGMVSVQGWYKSLEAIKDIGSHSKSPMHRVKVLARAPVDAKFR